MTFTNAQKHTFEKNNQSGKFCIRIIYKMSLCIHMSTSRNEDKRNFNAQIVIHITLNLFHA